ncbi:ATPase [Mycolicibacterium sp. P9-64]|uniref:ATPase n=1 Tax=Mycolicibacterium sp. P9-64 TaxID=2024612 RepID=UPI00322168BF
MRRILAAALVAWGAVSGLVGATAANATPGDCPPFCDGIPDSAWIAPDAIPLSDVYHWPALAGLATTAPSPRFRFEETCAARPVAADPRGYAVASSAQVNQPNGQWQLRVQMLHWRGDAWKSGQLAVSALQNAVGALRACAATAPWTSPSITTDQPGRVAAVISTAGQQVLHEYLLADARSGTLVDLAMWTTLPKAVEWRAVPDPVVFDAMGAPLCTAYVGSCG